MYFEELANASEKLPLILLVDDDANDVQLVKAAFARGGLKHPLRSVSGGLEAMAYLKGDVPYSDRAEFPLPSLIFLDIKMPPPDGFEVLRWIRQQTRFDKVCVVMLTGSDDIKDANTAYRFGADSFLVKPLDFWNAVELMQSLGRMIKSN